MGGPGGEADVEAEGARRRDGVVKGVVEGVGRCAGYTDIGGGG